MLPRRFDGSADWVAPVRAVEAIASTTPADAVPPIQRAALTLLALLAIVVLALSVAAQAS